MPAIRLSTAFVGSHRTWWISASVCDLTDGPNASALTEGCQYVAICRQCRHVMSSVTAGASNIRPAGQNPARQAFPSGPRSLRGLLTQYNTRNTLIVSGYVSSDSYPSLSQDAKKFTSLFGSTYCCEQLFQEWKAQKWNQGLCLQMNIWQHHCVFRLLLLEQISNQIKSHLLGTPDHKT